MLHRLYISFIVGIITTSILCVNQQAACDVDVTSPTESLYDINYSLSVTSCDPQKYRTLCGTLSILDVKQCELMTDPCDIQARLRVSFKSYKSYQALLDFLTIMPKMYEGMVITSYSINDVNECMQNINECSINGYCINIQGSYRCECGVGFKSPEQSTALPGMVCVARCNARSCTLNSVCSEASDELSAVSCECESGYKGDNCEMRSNMLADWAIVLIAVVAGLAAFAGITLCIYTCFRLCCRRYYNDDDSDTQSINDYKPRAMPTSEYDRFTDLGSIGRNNRGFASTIDEESERGTIKNDGLRFGPRLLSPRLSIPSEHGDPTPVMRPYHRNERHTAEIVSQPDYY